MIEYINISIREYIKLSEKERQTKSFCIEIDNEDYGWKVNDLLHREDGPGMITRRSVRWYLNGKRYLFEEWCEILNKSDEEKIFLKLKYS